MSSGPILNTFASTQIMQACVPYTLKNQHLWLSTSRSIFWEEQKSLIVSDLHFGKTGHFRKSGVAIPQAVYKEDLQRLLEQIQYFGPARLVIVGDLFHSEANKELDLFRKWRENFPALDIQLVKGNHDILQEEWYALAGISLHRENLLIDAFHFIHDIALSDSSTSKTANYFFSGHIHPGIRISGAGKQSLCFPCFYFGREYAVLPAFSQFTGVALIDPGQGEHVFAILPSNHRKQQFGSIIQIQ
jgi:uncharacterized protein